MALNVTTAVFGENCNTATASPSLAQWDQGQKLKIEGVDLPASYQVEFSTAYTRNAIPAIGDASGVTIPNVLLQRSAPITAYIVLHEGENDRETEYWITIHITPRTPPETITPDPEEKSVIDQTIAALQEGVADAEAAATSAEGSASDAADHAADAEAWAVGQRAGEDVPDTDPTYHNNSKYYAGRAEAAAEKAGQHEASWESWAQRAETAADEAEESARAAAASKADAESEAQTATQQATAAENSATAAAGSAASARQTVDGAIGAINTAKEDALTAIGSAGSNAVGAVEQAGTTQVNRVQTKGDEVIGSIPQDYTDLVDDVTDLNRQLNDLESAIIADINEQSLWANGAIASATGIVTTSTTRIVSSELPNSASKVIPVSGYKYIIAAYDDDGYVGMWNGNSLPKSATWLTVATDLKLIGDYVFRLVLARSNDASIDVDAYVGLQITEISDSTLKMRGFPADASAVGDMISAISNSLAPISKNTKSVYLGLHEYAFPTAFDMESPVHVYTDGCNYITDFNADDYKNTGGIIYYVGHNGIGASTNPSAPGTYSAALTAASDGDTIIIQPGIYTRDDPAYSAPNPITKSVNIIAPDGAVFLDGNYMTYTKTQGYTNVYDTDRTLTSRVIDTSIDGKYIAYKAVATIQEVDETPGSYYFDTPKVYVHSIDNSNPTGKVINCLNYEKFLDINNSFGDVKVYIEGITLVGKSSGILIDKTVVENSLNVCFSKVSAILCGNDTTEKDSFMVYGGNVIFNKCTVLSSYKDGFNYSGRNFAGDTCICECTEIDCIGAGVGHEATNAVQNATTAHQRAKIIRINGKYYDSNGGNVADVQTGTQTVNIGCMAFSPFTTGGYSQNFTLQQSGAEMWLEGCIASGAKYDIFCTDDATIHANNTAYETKSIYQQGTFEESNSQTVMGLALKRGLLFGIT